MKNLHKSVKVFIFVAWTLFCFYGLPRIYHRTLPMYWDMAAWFLTAPPLLLYGGYKYAEYDNTNLQERDDSEENA